ncbi:MAG TPA: alpha/beta hydrolase-fold protein [Streptosporangiaceae bacterium]|nr:alpha/beta hydrolase-fold protein [Streptosporangiaceae bacterium]
MLFGVAAVNRYYNYYETWGAVEADFTNQGVATLPQVPHLANKGGDAITRLGLSPEARAEATQTGYLFETVVKGKLSKISRTVYIYLPPQYFLAKYASYRFPAIELLHGSPGNPEQWINPMNILPTLDDMMASHQADPVVLVMPDTNGGQQYSLQCLNAVGGPRDATYVALDVPDFVAANYHVQPPGRAWGVAGLSEGGFCAANLSLQYPTRFGYAGVMSGYFAPLDNQVPEGHRPGARPVYALPFRGQPALKAKNTPDQYITKLPPGTLIPQFFLAAGADDAQDVQAAQSFRQELQLYQADVPLHLVPNSSHDANAWRGAERPMLSWMTPQLAHQAAEADAASAARQRAEAAASAKAKAKSKSKGGVIIKPVGTGAPTIAK